MQTQSAGLISVDGLQQKGPAAHHSSPITHYSAGRGEFPSMQAFRKILKEMTDLELLWGEPMANLTSFRIGGPVACVARPLGEYALRELLAAVRSEGIPHVIIGGGSNVLAPDGPWHVLVIQVFRAAGKMLKLCADGAQIRLVHVGAGVKLSTLLRFSVCEELEGLEALVGIPGTVGGAVVMNAGSREGSIADALVWVDLLDESGGKRRVFRDELPAGYRNMGLPENAVVLGACLELRTTKRAFLKERMAKTMKQRRQSQPIGFPSAGCIFKNPPGISAGALIDQAGLKGLRFGDAEVSMRHANWIINRGKARAADVVALMEHMEGVVFSRFGIQLEREVRVLGEGKTFH